MSQKKRAAGPAAIRHGELRLSAGWVIVTPAIAAGFLEANNNPRDLSQARVDEIAEDILLDGWAPNGETIKVDAKGNLRDGQHRCAAIVQSGKPCLCLVVYGVADEGVERTDEGKARTYADVLKNRGEAQASQLCAVVKALRRMLLYHATEKREALSDRCRPANSALDRVLRRHPGVRDSMKAIEMAYRARMGTRTNLATLHYLFSRVDQEVADELVGAIASGEGLAADDPVLLYRKRKIEAAVARDARIGPIEECALLIKCWNAWRQQRPVANLRWRRFGNAPESFPLIDGLVAALGKDDVRS